jgi:hypothetical protein
MHENLDHPFTRRSSSSRGTDVEQSELGLLGLLSVSGPPQPGVLAALAEIIAHQKTIISNQEKILSDQEKLFAK